MSVWVVASTMSSQSNELPHDDNIYRVVIYPSTKSVLVTCFGMEGVDMAVEGAYDSVDELPE